jgi:hypothetical protein
MGSLLAVPPNPVIAVPTPAPIAVNLRFPGLENRGWKLEMRNPILNFEITDSSEHNARLESPTSAFKTGPRISKFLPPLIPQLAIDP